MRALTFTVIVICSIVLQATFIYAVGHLVADIFALNFLLSYPQSIIISMIITMFTLVYDAWRGYK